METNGHGNQLRMGEHEMIPYFILTLPNPFYKHMIESTIKEFSDAIEIREQLDMGTKEGRLNEGNPISNGEPSNESFNKKKGPHSIACPRCNSSMILGRYPSLASLPLNCFKIFANKI